MGGANEPTGTWRFPTRAIALVLGTLLAAPGAVAAMTLELTPPAGPVDPETGVEPLTWTATIDCTDLVAGPGAAGVAGPTVLELQIEARSHLSIVGPSAQIVDQETCATDPIGTAIANGTFHVTIGRDAPGLTPLPVRMSAVLHRPTPLSEAFSPVNASAETAVQAAPFFRIQAKIAENAIETAGGEVVFDVEMTNFGNTPVLVMPSMVDAPEGSSSWFQGTDPLPLAWNGDDDGQARDTLQLRFDVPRSGLWSSSEAAFTFTFTSSHEDQEGEPVTSNVLIRHRGSSLSQPSPAWGLLLVVPALVAIAVVLRRRS